MPTDTAPHRPKKQRKPKKKPTETTDIVVHTKNEEDDPEEQRLPQSPPRRQRRPGNNRARGRNRPQEDDDEVSEVSDGDASDDEPRFKYSTSALPDNSGRNTKCCLIAFCLLCIIVAIALSIVMKRTTDDSAEKNARETGAPSAAPTGIDGLAAVNPARGKFGPSKEQMDAACQQQGGNDKNECQNLCRDFESCCDATLPQDQSCFYHNRQGCMDAASCHVLNQRFEAAPSNLVSICSPARVASNPDACEIACRSAECCWNPEAASCVATDLYACLDYASCQNLNGGNIPVASSTLTDFCDINNSGLSQQGNCGNECAVADCCWAEDNAANCLFENFLTCVTYAPCPDLEIAPADQGTITPAPADLSQSCSFVQINAGNTAACEAACAGSASCTPGAGFPPNNTLACLTYDKCQLLEN